MIRSVVGLFVFAVLLCGYIVLRPSSYDQPRTTDPLGVTRAQTDSILGPLPNALSSNDVVLTQAPMRELAPGLALATDKAPMDQTAANVLAGLGLSAPQSPNAANDPMRDMTASVLSGIGAITGQSVLASGGAPAAASALELLVVQALKEGQNDAFIDTLVNEAAKAGKISVPDILVTSSGDVDTAVLLSSIVTQAQIAAGAPAPGIPDVPAGDGTGVEVRIVQRATETEQYRFYTVAPGDSLGAISVKFYGNVSKFGVIFEANRKVLSSPNAIQVGQRLAIPTI